MAGMLGITGLEGDVVTPDADGTGEPVAGSAGIAGDPRGTTAGADTGAWAKGIAPATSGTAGATGTAGGALGATGSAAAATTGADAVGSAGTASPNRSC